MLTRYEIAVRLDIPLEMASKHGIPARMSEKDFDLLDADPPPWLAQSRANRTGKRPVWTQLTCDICGYTEAVRPKKWWPEFTFVFCDNHAGEQLPEPFDPAAKREFVYGVGSQFTGVVDRAE